MRGIERVLTGIVLVAAVGGAAVFARQSGSGLAGAVHLAAPPEQHLAAPGLVLIAPTASADHSQSVLGLAVSPLLQTRPALSGKTTPLRPATIVPTLTQPRTAPEAPGAGPSPAPFATPTPGATPAPPATPATPAPPVASPVEAPPRVVASAQPEPAPAPAAPLPPVTVTSTNVHGLAQGPQPPVDSAPSGDDAQTLVTEPVQGVHIKGIPNPTGD